MGVCFAVWLLLTLSVIVVLRRQVKRARLQDAGLCVRCGYNLTGLPEPRCPECGEAFERKGDAV